MVDQREAEASTAPGFPDADAGDPAHFIAASVADQRCGYVVSVPDGEPEIGRRGWIVEPAATPLVKRLRLVAPLFGEGVLARGLERFGVLAVE